VSRPPHPPVGDAVGGGAGAATWVHDLSRGGRHQQDLLGGKGANLAEMTRLGLRVPPGFTITTDVCRFHLEHGSTPPDLAGQVTEHLTALEEAVGRTLGDPADPLLVAVRSGAAASMPGMMETVLDVGLDDDSVQGLAARSGSDRFAWDCYRRLVQVFGRTVLGIDGDQFESVLDEVRREQGGDLDAEHLRAVVGRFGDIVREHTGRDFPQDPREQLDLAIDAVLDSWNSRTTATCATSSSPSSAARCGCCRPAWARAPRPRRSSSPPSWSTRASSTWTRRCGGSAATSSPS
jgi:pyruvate, orthophosphate dikinase